MKNKVKFRQLGSVTLFVLPALIPLIVFWIYPILRSVYISFTDWDYMTPDYNFVFFDNFISLFQDARFYDALWNSCVYIGNADSDDRTWSDAGSFDAESI